MAGICARSIEADVIVIGIMSSLMPNDSTCSRCFVSASTDHFSSSFADGMLPQMLLTPKAAIALRMASSSPCCVPTWNFTFDDAAALVLAGAGVLRDLRRDERFGNRASSHPAACKADEFAAIH